MSINDWAAKAAERISSEFPSIKHPDMLPSDERIAAIIATFAEPLVALLRDSRRQHHHEEDDSWYCCGACTHECEAVEEGRPRPRAHRRLLRRFARRAEARAGRL